MAVEKLLYLRITCPAWSDMCDMTKLQQGLVENGWLVFILFLHTTSARTPCELDDAWSRITFGHEYSANQYHKRKLYGRWITCAI